MADELSLLTCPLEALLEQRMTAEVWEEVRAARPGFVRWLQANARRRTRLCERGLRAAQGG
jgi:hypothetical protein